MEMKILRGGAYPSWERNCPVKQRRSSRDQVCNPEVLIHSWSAQLLSFSNIKCLNLSSNASSILRPRPL